MTQNKRRLGWRIRLLRLSGKRGYGRIAGKMFLAFSLVALLPILAGCSTGFASTDDKYSLVVPTAAEAGYSPLNGKVQSDDGGAVVIEVEWLGLHNDLLMLDVAMNTHSVDLDGYDLTELAILRDDEGNEYQASSWDSAPGGHHRQGLIHFPVPHSLSQGTADYLEVVIRNIAGIDERVLKWDL